MQGGAGGWARCLQGNLADYRGEEALVLKALPDFSRVDSSVGLMLCVGKVSCFNWLM